MSLMKRYKRKAAEEMSEMPEMDSAPAPKSISEAIMSKRKMAKGGLVDEYPDNNYEDMNEQAALKENYDDTEDHFDGGPMDPGAPEHIEDEPMDAYDMVSQIRKKMAKRGR